MKYLEKWMLLASGFFVLVFLDMFLIKWLNEQFPYHNLTAYSAESDGFRAMRLGDAIVSQSTLNPEQITALMLENDFDLTKLENLNFDSSHFLKRKPIEYRKLCQAYACVLSDLRYFPIPESTNPDVPAVTFEDSWQDERTYGGNRGHEGCDIMGMERPRGFYPVISMTDGTIEKIGWLEKGGWRIGVRAPGGAYLYYAHLYSYSEDWKEGDTIQAGELLGFMGDSGYSKTEGAVGNFPVHLHLGIYLKTDHYDEVSINPYWILKYFMKFPLKYAY